MSAALFTIDDIEQGADWRLYLTFQNADGTALSLAGSSLRMQIRTDYSDNSGAIVANLTSSSGGITITSTANGTATVSLTAAQTANLTGGDYLYDLKLIDATGVVDRELQGGVHVSPGVTTL